MNTKQMTYLIETAKTLNLSRAAEQLYISQPSLSYQIKTIEEEVGFAIFDRIGKSIRLTPAGTELITSLQRISMDLQFAIEQAQNINHQYTDTIKVGMPTRTALYHLPDAIRWADQTNQSLQIIPEIQPSNDGITAFMRKELDLLLLPKEEAKKLSSVNLHPLFTSHIFLLCRKDDPLAQQTQVSITNLANRTLLVNGGSSPTLRRVQQRVVDSVPIQTMNSPTHDVTLIQVAAGRAVCLSPGFLNDQSGQYAWVPFVCEESFDFVLVSHKEAQDDKLKQVIKNLQALYQDSPYKF